MQTPMPKTIRASLWILVGSTIGSLVIAVLEQKPIPTPPNGIWLMVLMTVLFVGVTVFLVVMTYRRRNWARWVYALIFVFGSLPSVPAQLRELSTAPVMSSIDLIMYVGYLISVALLFAPKSNAWYSEEVLASPNNSLQRP